MCAGRLLAPLGGRCVEVHVEVALAARIFGMNLASWRDGALARGLADADRLDDVAHRLAALADSGTDIDIDDADAGDGRRRPRRRWRHAPARRAACHPRPTVRWVLRQVVCPA